MDYVLKMNIDKKCEIIGHIKSSIDYYKQCISDLDNMPEDDSDRISMMNYWLENIASAVSLINELRNL